MNNAFGSLKKIESILKEQEQQAGSSEVREVQSHSPAWRKEMLQLREGLVGRWVGPQGSLLGRGRGAFSICWPILI